MATRAASLQVLTKSRLASYRACPRRHQYAYEIGVRPVYDAEELRFGTLAHLCLEQWWLAARSGTDRLARALSAIPENTDAFDRARISAMMTGYTERWASQRYEVIGVEVEFSCPVVNPRTDASSRTFQLAGKIDAIVRDLDDGRKLIVEHKTSSEDISDGSAYGERLKLDGQISAYHRGAASLGHEIFACLFDVLGKPALKPLKATPPESRKYTKEGKLYANQRDLDESPDEYEARIMTAIAENPGRYLARWEVVRLEREMEENALDVWLTALAIRENQRAGVWPRNPDACFSRGRTCPYFQVCVGQQDIDDPLHFRRVENIHSELTLPKEEAQHVSGTPGT